MSQRIPVVRLAPDRGQAWLLATYAGVALLSGTTLFQLRDA
jgi:hypothetical protein